jgi:predicted O-methyltransferase YrrM
VIKATDITARVAGMMVLEEVALLMDLAERAPDMALEVGAYLGLSACAMAARCPHPVYSVDPFEERIITSPVYPLGFEYLASNEDGFRANVERMGLTERVHLLKQPSIDASRRWRKPLGLLLIDADHTQAVEDVAAWAGFVVPGGYLLLHDKNEPAVQAAMAVIEASGEWTHVRTVNLLVAYRRTGDALPPVVIQAVAEAAVAAVQAAPAKAKRSRK